MTDVLDDILIQLEELNLRMRMIEDELREPGSVWSSSKNTNEKTGSSGREDHDDC